MLTVSQDTCAVELGLMQGQLSCPGCAGRLRPWGWARSRRVRDGVGGRQCLVGHRPRRSRCVGCGATHVLLAVSLAARRADTAAVIGDAVEDKVIGGRGHRVIAARVGRPASTVRGWLRAFAASAAQISAMFTSLVHRDAPDAAGIWPAPAPGASAQALSALAAYAEGLRQRFASVVAVAWVQAGIAACGGWLFCASWWAERSQHEHALTGGPGPRQVGQERLA